MPTPQVHYMEQNPYGVSDEGYAGLGTGMTITGTAPNATLIHKLRVSALPITPWSASGAGSANSGAWSASEGGMCAILRTVVYVAGAAGTTSASLNIGTCSVSNSSSGNLINSLNVNTAAGVFDNLANPGSLGKSIQLLYPGNFITVTSLIDTVSTTPVSASLYIEYMPVAAVPTPGI